MATVRTPVDGWSGAGPGGVIFTNGKAQTDDPRLIRYFRKAGYTVTDTNEPADPRDVTEVRLGTPLRDAAVDPRAGDFLPPTNAGDANPHGPECVSPGLHAVPPAPIAPGVVPDEAKAQETKETDLASAVLVEGQEVGDATRAVPDADAPASVEGEPAGASARATDGTSDTTGPTTPDPVPAKVATKRSAKKAAPRTTGSK